MRPGIAVATALFALGIIGPADGASSSAAGDTPQIVLPHDGDEYSKLVARAAAHDNGLDFRALRFAWLKSAARGHDKADHYALKDALFAAIKAGDDRGVRDVAVKMVSADYIDMFGHKFLRQACAALHDDACAEQGHFVEFGLLKSIVATGDGKTCDTGWEVVAVTEEYFMIDMLHDQPVRQSIVSGKHGACDLMKASDESGNIQDYYFRIDTVLADEQGGLGR